MGSNGNADDKGSEKVYFKDVIGIDEYKQEVMELVDFIQNPSKYQEIGAKLPKGILLTGSPGVGKTMLIKALANETNCNLIFKSGGEFDEIFVGVGA